MYRDFGIISWLWEQVTYFTDQKIVEKMIILTFIVYINASLFLWWLFFRIAGFKVYFYLILELAELLLLFLEGLQRILIFKYVRYIYRTIYLLRDYAVERLIGLIEVKNTFSRSITLTGYVLWHIALKSNEPIEVIKEFFLGLRVTKKNSWLGNFRRLYLGNIFSIAQETVSLFYSLPLVAHCLKYMSTSYTFFKGILVSIFSGTLLFNYLYNFFNIIALKQLAAWFIVGFMLLWLLSGFNFFLKRYKFGKFTTAVQRFWKRTNVYFWLIEGFLFAIFFYYYLNSSQEPAFMYDSASSNVDTMPLLSSAYESALVLLLIIFILYYLLINLSGLSTAQCFAPLLITFFLSLYIYIQESYQVYYVLTTFSEYYWNFNSDTMLWSLECDSPRLRVKTQYLMLCLIAKYWHFLFIFLSWVFILIKMFELRRISYTLLSLAIQNYIILFILNLLTLTSWVLWLVRRFYSVVYFWFFINTTFSLYLYFLEELAAVLAG